MAEPVGLIFDLDGTLIDSAPDIHATANLVFTAEGLAPFEFATVRGFIGNGVGSLVAQLMQARGLDARGPTHARLVAKFISLYEEAIDLTLVYPGVVAALDQLAAHHPMAICTNKPKSPALSVLRHFGLDRFFLHVIGGDSLPQRKPDPMPLLAAQTALGCDRILFVGDSEVDAETAARAERPLLLYTEGYRKIPAEAIGAKAIFAHYDDFPALVRSLAALP